MLGEPVARRLAEEGHTVRVMSRNLNKLKQVFDDTTFQFVQGNVEDETSLKKAMTGCTGVHLNLSGSGEQNGAAIACKVASEIEGMKRITVITGATTCPENAWFPGTRAKLQAEDAIKASGVPYTIFRCTMFMESLPKWTRGGRAFIVGNQPTLWRWVAASDYANMVARAYSSLDKSANKTLYVYGPEALTMEQALDIYIKRCAPDITIRHLPFWQARITSWMPGNEHLRTVILPWMEYFTKVSELGDQANVEEANNILCPPVVTVNQWCEAHVTNINK
jgi:uncharacterized protein YbjT (DUF2867 family)